MSFAEHGALGAADRRARDAQEQTQKMHTALQQWKKQAQQLQAALNEQVIETARMEVLRESLLTELLRVDPNNYLKNREARIALANDKDLVSKAVATIGRPDLADKV